MAAGQCTKVDPAVRPEIAGLLGCGVMAGLGAALNTAAIRRGETVAVIGCGGVGDAAILGASFAGARTVVAVESMGDGYVIVVRPGRVRGIVKSCGRRVPD